MATQLELIPTRRQLIEEHGAGPNIPTSCLLDALEYDPPYFVGPFTMAVKPTMTGIYLTQVKVGPNWYSSIHWFDQEASRWTDMNGQVIGNLPDRWFGLNEEAGRRRRSLL